MGVGFLLGVFVGTAASALWFLRRGRPVSPLDELTGVPTRRVAKDALRSLRRGDAVVMVDLDTLKSTNDAHGHGAGDNVLSAVAAHLASQVRAGDTMARWGGDEFVIVLRAGGAAAGEVVDRLRQSAPATFSAGVAVHTAGAGEATLAKADAALLAAKRAGGGRVVVQ